MSMIRTRWAAFGAAVAVTLGAGGIAFVDAAPISSGERAVFVAITPCRVADTRAGQFNVGPRATPLGTDDAHTIAAHGSNGQCEGIPADAVALSLNVTALGATLPTFLTVSPTGEPRPDASNLNPDPGEPPTPNAVTTGLSNDGEFDVYNKQGNVDIIVDINGYYVDHTHDDRYFTKSQVYTKGQTDAAIAAASGGGGVDAYTKAQTNALLANKANTADVTGRSQTLTLFGADASPVGNRDLVLTGGTCASAGVLLLGLPIPVGSTVTQVRAHVFDSDADGNQMTVQVFRNSPTATGLDAVEIATFTDLGADDNVGSTELIPLAESEVIDVGESLSVRFGTANSSANALCSVEVDYTLPGL